MKKEVYYKSQLLPSSISEDGVLTVGIVDPYGRLLQLQRQLNTGMDSAPYFECDGCTEEGCDIVALSVSSDEEFTIEVSNSNAESITFYVDMSNVTFDYQDFCKNLKAILNGYEDKLAIEK